MRPPGAPATEAELLRRATALAGYTLAQLAERLGLALPRSNTRGKGWAGQALELALGASAGSVSAPDFPALGIELKSIPVAPDGRPLESTYVCVAPLLPGPEAVFETSCVARKLARVLWMPIEATARQPLAGRRLGRAVLWSPDERQWADLRADFDEHMERVQLGQIGTVTARHGELLQLRPKGASAAERTPAVGPGGRRIWTNPRGFYLRADFTGRVLREGLAALSAGVGPAR